jgi:hypothetical protein
VRGLTHREALQALSDALGLDVSGYDHWWVSRTRSRLTPTAADTPEWIADKTVWLHMGLATWMHSYLMLDGLPDVDVWEAFQEFVEAEEQQGRKLEIRHLGTPVMAEAARRFRVARI